MTGETRPFNQSKDEPKGCCQDYLPVLDSIVLYSTILCRRDVKQDRFGLVSDHEPVALGISGTGPWSGALASEWLWLHTSFGLGFSGKHDPTSAWEVSARGYLGKERQRVKGFLLSRAPQTVAGAQARGTF